MSDLDDFTRFATAKSFREALEHVPEDGLLLVNRVLNINVYDSDSNWLGIINLRNVRMHNGAYPDWKIGGPDEPLAEWEEMGEEWR